MTSLPTDPDLVAARVAIAGFLETIFGDAQGVVSIWTAPDRQSRFFANTDQGRADAADYAVQRSGSADVYFGLGLLAEPLTKGRGKEPDVIGIGCLWADVDFGLGHKKTVAPDEATARAILSTVSAPPPSIIVHSGGGFHCYWLLTKPRVFTDDADRQRAAALVKTLQETIRSAFEASTPSAINWWITSGLLADGIRSPG